MPLLKEHNSFSLHPGFDLKGFKLYLNEVWANRMYLYSYEQEEETKSTKQQFLFFGHEESVKAGQYVGFVQYEDLKLTLYPKLFENLKEDEAGHFYRHLVHWLSYCRKINFPFLNILADLTRLDDLPEALIYYFSKRTLEVVQNYPYSQFENVKESLPFIKGKLQTKEYISHSLGSGNFHVFPCEHEPFIFNNLLNKIIKCVTRKLLNVCKFKETWYNLEQILFLLDEAEDTSISALDCEKVRLNPMFLEYQEVIDMCRFFLAGEQLNRINEQNRQICFLLPMNYLFEDYISGFIELKFGKRIKTRYQSKGWLTDQRIFQTRYDLLLLDENKNVALIVDTKYKLREDSLETSKGISQSDMYQMVSYALRNDCKRVLLLYPSLTYNGETPVIDRFTISSPMLNSSIEIYAANVCITDSDSRTIETKVYEQLEYILFQSNLIHS
jgi:5-methylcytosine-specific restriction enzyme subunit McrC